MRILVISDSHGNKNAVERVAALHDNARAIIFLGDGMRDIENLEYLYPDRPVYAVPGNCDYFSKLNEIGKTEIAGKIIYYSHGHLHGVKHDVDNFIGIARQAGADIALFGHTHVPFTKYENGMYVMNPGSLKIGSYGIIDITSAGIVTHTAKL